MRRVDDAVERPSSVAVCLDNLAALLADTDRAAEAEVLSGVAWR